MTTQSNAKVTPQEIEGINRQLNQIDHLLVCVMEALATIRLGLALAGYPVSMQEAIKHPAFEKAIRDREEVNRTKAMQEQLEALKREYDKMAAAARTPQCPTRPEPTIKSRWAEPEKWKTY